MKKSLSVTYSAFFLLCSSVGLGNANPFMSMGEITAPPIGHVEYCRENPSDCNESQKDPEIVILDIEGWRFLNEVNVYVNKEIKPKTDIENYQQKEKWVLPTIYGDCEDYVLLKRQMLHNAGFPLSSLLITVVRDQNGGGHAVLTVKTDRGDLILDNQADQVVTWDQTPYRYVKRQSENFSSLWRQIQDRR